MEAITKLKLATKNGVEDLLREPVFSFSETTIPFDPMICKAADAVRRFFNECDKASQYDKKAIIALENITNTRFYGYSVADTKTVAFDVANTELSVCIEPFTNPENYEWFENYIVIKPEDDFYPMFGLMLLSSDPCPDKQWELKNVPERHKKEYKNAVGYINLSRLMKQRNFRLESKVLYYERMLSLAPDEIIDWNFQMVMKEMGDE